MLVRLSHVHTQGCHNMLCETAAKQSDAVQYSQCSRAAIVRFSAVVVRFSALLWQHRNKESVSHMQQPYTCLRRQISRFRAAAFRCCVQHHKTAFRNYIQDATCSFSLRFLCDFRRTQGCYKARKAAARLLQSTQGVSTTDVRIPQRRICLMKAARLP